MSTRILLTVGSCFVAAAVFAPALVKAQQPQADKPTDAARTKFQFARRFDFLGKIEAVSGDGGFQAKEVQLPVPGGIESNPTEGLYIGLVTDRIAKAWPTAALVVRVEVAEILPDGKIRFEVAKSASEKIKAGSFIYLFRPRGATTAQMKALPDSADFSEGTDAKGAMSPADFAKLNTSMNNLKQLALALLSYEFQHERFPTPAHYGPDGKPTVSWRVLILPYLDESALYKQFKLDEPWDSPNNKPLLDKMPSVLHDPAFGSSKDSYTNYAAVSGPGTIFPTDQPDAAGNIDSAARTGVSIAAIKDGTSNTLLLGTVSPDEKIPWTKPQDIVCDDNLPAIGKPGSFAAPYKWRDETAGLFAFCDGHAESIRSDIPMDLFHKMTTRAGGDRYDPATIPHLSAPRTPAWALVITRGEQGASATIEFDSDQSPKR